MPPVPSSTLSRSKAPISGGGISLAICAAATSRQRTPSQASPILVHESAGPQQTAGSQPLSPDEFVLSADEKTSIQARARCHPTLPSQSGLSVRVEHEYRRLGAWAYLAAWDVHRAKLFGRCESQTGMAPFGRLVDQVMTQPPYTQARRVFWIVDNGSSHRGAACAARLQEKYPQLVVVHGPVHASWLNQIEIYFSILQRKALTPNDFSSLAALAERLLNFQRYYETIAQPFEWRFTRQDLMDLLERIKKHPNSLAVAA